MNPSKSPNTKSKILGVRVDLQTKKQIETLAKILGIDVSEIVRNYIAPFTEIAMELMTIRRIQHDSQTIAKLIIQHPEVQNILEQLYNYYADSTDIQYCLGNIHYCTLVPVSQYYYIEKTLDNKYRIIMEKKGSWFNDDLYVVEEYIENINLMDLADFLDTIQEFLRNDLNNLVENLEKTIRELVK